MYSSYYLPPSSSKLRESGYRTSSSRFLDATTSSGCSPWAYRDSYRPSVTKYVNQNRPNNNVCTNRAWIDNPAVSSRSAAFKRSMSLSPNRLDRYKFKETLEPIRSLIRDSFNDDSFSASSSSRVFGGGNRHISSYGSPNSGRAPSALRHTTRDELIDSILHTRTKEHRVMPGFHSASDWEERKALNIDCDRVYPGICLANGETIKNFDYLKSIGVTHVLNTAEKHVVVNPAKYPLHGISYFGFHVDDHPSANLSRFFSRTTDFIDEATRRGGLVVVNCVMGWSRSATIVAAYLMMKKHMSSAEALEVIRQARPIRPNPGFLQQLADHDNLLNKKLIWDGP